ncbi:VCBS repeat-containing protein [Streptomyces asoensis]|uniref:VCBS repeat-containing protein n=1 Tax=Streptomyces asoensis TaxID=249586 RepID=A0A6M4WRQ5_9ACTN|nr:VCBS repeat-containing protein [Streptomyces asoensis]QJT02612.1 VCBS repeat-containing protein [Streptomyces asoensis]
MARHGSARLRLVAASAVLAAGLTPLLPSTAVADTPQETVVPASLRDTYTAATLQSSSTHGSHDSAGAQGVFHSLEGTSGLLWTRYADGESVRVPTAPAGTVGTPTGTDVLAYHHSDGRVDFWDASDGSTQSLQVPDGLGYLTSYDNLTVAFKNVRNEDGTIVRVIHLLTPGPDGTTVDRTITGGPAGLVLGLGAAADAQTLYLRGSVDGQVGLVAVDRASSEVRGWSGPIPTGYTHTNLGGGHVVVFAQDKASVLVFPRDLSEAPVEVALKGVSDGVSATRDLALVGDWLVNGTSSTTAQPLTGGEPVTLLRSSAYGTAAGPDGTAVKIGRTGADDWGVQRITPGADGGPPVVTPVKALPKPPLSIQGLSLDQGRLVVLDHYGTGVRSARVRTVAPSGTPSFGERSRLTTFVPMADCATDAACAPVRGLADGRIAWLARDGATNMIEVDGPDADDVWGRPGLPNDGRITDVSGRYLLYTGPGGQYVYRIGSIDADPVVTRTPGPAALSGNILWTTGTTPGSVTAYDLTARKTTESLVTDAGCTPTELQALGRWLYWTCEGRAGVYDRTAHKSVPVPADEAELGDGYVVTHDKQAGKLVLTTVADGTPASRVIGDLPDTGVSQRDVRWTVDESGGNAAYVDAQERVHLVPSGVPQQPLRQLEPAQSVTQTSPGSSTLTTMLLSKPAAGWVLDVRSKATGKHVGGTDGGAVRGALNVNWNATDPSGVKPLPNGYYDWTVTVSPADGVGAPLQVRGTLRKVNGSAVFHDYVGPGARPDGAGDLLTMPSSGTLTYQQGTGQGTFSGQVSGSGWPTGIKAVPIGDLSGDSCNDVLVRLSSGALRLYRTGCGAAVRPTSPYTTLGTGGWTQFDILTSPGDVTKDGRPDLIARNPSTGRVYLYKGTAAGKLAAAVKLYDNWKTYKKIIGVGDLNGDGIGDLIAQDTSNNLYRYLGTGKGTFTARVKLFANWGASYNAVAGAGDITGDGKADLVVRDTPGGLYRLPGTGTGTFGARVKIGSGWQNHKGIF